MDQGSICYLAAAPFEAARQVSILPNGHRSRYLHGHSFMAKIRVPEGAFRSLFDGAEVDALTDQLRHFISPLNYSYLNETIDVPTDENIARWIYAQANSGTRSILRKAGEDKDKDYDFKLFAARNPNFSFGDGSQNVVLHSSSAIPLNEWTHITLTRDETEAAIHVNGAQLMRKTYDFAPSATPHKLIIGGGSLQPYLGKIDDVQIYDTVLSVEEIESLGCKADL